MSKWYWWFRISHFIKWPWHYLLWKPFTKTDEEDCQWAQIIRKKGIFWVLKIFWGIFDDEGRWKPLTVYWFFWHNWAGFVALAGWGAGLEDCLIPLIAWVFTLLYGTGKFIAWAIAITHRWPPMAAG